MNNPHLIPTSLRIVAVLFVLGGIFSIFEIIAALARGSLRLESGVLGLMIGPGLLRLSRGWRTCALVFLWIGMIAMPIIAVFFLIASGPFPIKFFGYTVGYGPKGLGVVLSAAVFALLVWQYRALTSQDVRRLFGIPDA